jgi:hypothetical protein
VRPYTELAGFADVVLEESYVLSICATPGKFEITVELVLTPDHPAYAVPPADENECYRRGTIRFSAVKRLVWDDQGARPATDATGQVDFGHIDVFGWDAERFELRGDFGAVDLVAGGVTVGLTDPIGDA